MHITQITVSYGETQSLPEYSNVKPNLTITATLDEGDSPGEVEQLLWNEAKAAVHAQIDFALEANGKPAKYDPAPRYQVLRTYWNQWDHRGEAKPRQYVIIAPDEIKLDRDAYAQRLIVDSSKLRLGHAQKVAAELLGDKDEGYTLLDCSNGDLTALNLAIPAPEPAPDPLALADPIDAAPDGVDEEWEGDDDEDEDE